MFEVKRESTIGEVLRQDVNTAPIFMDFGMHCLGCPMSQQESIEEAGQVHNVDVDGLISALNQHFETASA